MDLRLWLIICGLQLWNFQEAKGQILRSKEKYQTITYNKVSWFEAQSICHRSKMILATIPNVQREDQLIHTIANSGIFMGYEKFWLGGNNLAELNKWNWNGVGLPFGYQNWAKDEPKSDLTGKEACLILGIDNKWYSEDCQNEYFIVCERRCNSTDILEPIYI